MFAISFAHHPSCHTSASLFFLLLVFLFQHSAFKRNSFYLHMCLAACTSRHHIDATHLYNSEVWDQFVGFGFKCDAFNLMIHYIGKMRSNIIPCNVLHCYYHHYFHVALESEKKRKEKSLCITLSLCLISSAIVLHSMAILFIK